MFWIGLLCGAFVGAPCGAFLMSWLVAGKIADLEDELATAYEQDQGNYRPPARRNGPSPQRFQRRDDKGWL